MFQRACRSKENELRPQKVTYKPFWLSRGLTGRQLHHANMVLKHLRVSWLMVFNEWQCMDTAKGVQDVLQSSRSLITHLYSAM